MNDIEKLNRVHETIAWGAIFLWWGITELFRLPNGMDALGIGMILLGLMTIRSLSGLHTNRFTILLGIISLAWGIFDLANAFKLLPFKLPTFALLLIVFGATLLMFALARVRQANFAEGS